MEYLGCIVRGLFLFGLILDMLMRSVYTRVCDSVCAHAHVRVCVCVYIYIYIYIYIKLQTVGSS